MDNRFGNICTCTRCNGIVHTIRRGDTLYLLSRHYNVSVNDIMNANRNVNIYNLRIGDQICIPVRRMMDGNIIDEIREEIREEIRDEIQESIEVSEMEHNDSVEFMQVNQNDVVEEKSSLNDMKVSDLLSQDMTVSQLAKMLKEID